MGILLFGGDEVRSGGVLNRGRRVRMGIRPPLLYTAQRGIPFGESIREQVRVVVMVR